jgi:hypothetical protein
VGLADQEGNAVVAYQAYRQAVGMAYQQGASLQHRVEGTGRACLVGRRPCVAEGTAAYRSEA